jgi:anti-sigma factor RsiW
MSCNLTEKVSLLVDGELSSKEAGQVTLHLSSCLICQQAQADFLSLREQIKSHPYERDLVAERRAIKNILSAGRTPIWRRRVALPAPVFSLALLALIALTAWFVYTRASRPAPSEIGIRPAIMPAENPSQGSPDLSRFDRGERAVIYIERRNRAGATEQ